MVRGVVRSVATVVVLVLVPSACGSDHKQGAATPTVASQGPSSTTAPTAGGTVFVGKVRGTPAYIAVGIGKSGDAVVYVCDSARLVAYLRGSSSGSSVRLTEAGGIKVAATVNGAEATGTVTLSDGTGHGFRAARATGDAGYFRIHRRTGNVVTLGGWIRLADGSVRGALSKVTVSSTDPAQVGVTSEPAGASVPPDAVPLKFGGRLLCGIAGFEFKRIRDRFVSGEPGVTRDQVDAAQEKMTEACSAAA